MRRLIYKFVLYVNIFLVILLLLSYLAVFISPEKNWPVAFLGLAYPYLLFANIIMMFFWLLYRKKAFFLSLIIIILGWSILTSYIQINFKFLNKKEMRQMLTREDRSNKNTLKVLTYNVRAFNQYNWAQNIQAKDSIFKFLIRENPDVICFQEYFAQDVGLFTVRDLYKLLEQTPYKHVYYTIGEQSNYHYGIATFSSYPITGKGIIRFENTVNTCIHTDIAFHDDTIRIFNNHLQSIYFNASNYTFFDSLGTRYTEQQLNEILDISYRLKDAFIKRAGQADIISAQISKSPYPVIVCGDFNDTPSSYTYRKMKKGLSDSFVQSGSGIGNTYSGSFPSFRIDYIFHSPEMESLYNETVKIPLSDHFPVISYLQLR